MLLSFFAYSVLSGILASMTVNIEDFNQLYIIGEISVFEIFISIIIMVLFIYILLKKGLKVYKNGILNYSTDKVWNRVFKSMKN